MRLACIEKEDMNKHLDKGLRTLAKIIARDFMAKQLELENREVSNNDKSNK